MPLPADPVVDYRKAKERAAGCVLEGLAALKISGPDRRDFLQGQISCDAKSASADRALASCLTTPKGRLIAHFELFEKDGASVLVGPEAPMREALKALS